MVTAFTVYKLGSTVAGSMDRKAENFHLDIYVNNPKNDANYQVYV